MNALCLLTGLIFFVLALVSHVLIGKFFKIRREIACLALLFLLIMPLLLAGFFAGRQVPLGEFYASAMVYLSLALAYLQTYPALKTEIPTFRILLLIHRAKREGLTIGEIEKNLSGDAELYNLKMTELQEDRLLDRQEGRWVLKRAGALLADTFILYRRLLGLKSGRG